MTNSDLTEKRCHLLNYLQITEEEKTTTSPALDAFQSVLPIFALYGAGVLRKTLF